MAKALHAIEYLARTEKHPPRSVCVVFGAELFLRRQVLLKLREAVLGGDEGDFSLSSFDGREALLREVSEELGTVAMFGGRRMVVVEEADDFVTRYRSELEDYVARPSRTSVLVLDVKAWSATTRLYKAVDAGGLGIDCNAPTGAPLARWLGDWARQTHEVQLPPPVAEVLIDMIGPELGLLDQELAKLALVSGPERKITLEMVSRLVGSWRAKSTWDMLDAALDGRAVEAVEQLDRLLASGEAPIGILAQIASSLRRMAAATRLILQGEAAGNRIPLGQALKQAGTSPYALAKVERQLRRLGRERGGQLYDWLLEADLDLKGDSPMPPRLILERLIVRLAAEPEASRQ